MSGAYNPAAGTFGNWTTNPNKPTIQLGSVGDAVRYMEGVLKWCCGASDIHVNPNGTWCLFTNGDHNHIVNFQAWWHQYDPNVAVDGIVGPQTWGLLDYTAFNAGRG